MFIANGTNGLEIFNMNEKEVVELADNDLVKQELLCTARYYLLSSEGKEVVRNAMLVNEAMTAHVDGDYCSYDFSVDEEDMEIANLKIK